MRQERSVIVKIEGLNTESKSKILTESLPIGDLEKLMECFDNSESWKDRALSILNDLSETKSIQFNLNLDLGRLVVCNYPDKLVISSPKDPNNFSGVVSTKSGSFLKEQRYIIDRVLSVREYAYNGINGKTLGLYGQLNFTSKEQSYIAESQIETLLDSLKGKIEGVVTSGTLLGIGGLGHTLAKVKNLSTIGIVPHTSEVKVDKSKFDILLLEGEDWGDSSFLFGGLADCIIFMGGGYWSYLEYKYARWFSRKVRLFESSNLRYTKEFLGDRQALSDFDKDLLGVSDYIARSIV